MTQKQRVPGYDGQLLTKPSIMVKKPKPLNELRLPNPGPPKRAVLLRGSQLDGLLQTVGKSLSLLQCGGSGPTDSCSGLVTLGAFSSLTSKQFGDSMKLSTPHVFCCCCCCLGRLKSPCLIPRNLIRVLGLWENQAMVLTNPLSRRQCESLHYPGLHSGSCLPWAQDGYRAGPGKMDMWLVSRCGQHSLGPARLMDEQAHGGAPWASRLGVQMPSWHVPQCLLPTGSPLVAPQG